MAIGDLGTIHVQQPLTNLVNGFKQAAMIWRKTMAVAPVDKETDKFYKINEEFLRFHDKRRADGGEALDIVPFKASTSTYTCLESSYKRLVTKRTMSLADRQIRPDVRATFKIMQAIELDREFEAKDMVFGAGNYGASYKVTLTSANNWDADGNGKPVIDVAEKKDLIAKQIGVEPNTLTVGKEVDTQLKNHPDLIAKFENVKEGPLSDEQVAKALDVPFYVVGKGIYVTSKPNQTVAKDFIWGKQASLAYVPQGTLMDEPAFAYMLLHKLFGTNTAKIIRYDWAIKGGFYIEGSSSFTAVASGQNAGYLWSDAVS